MAYVRVSTTEQGEDGVSLEAQRSRIESWCSATGAELVGILEDAGVSGSLPLSRRPGGSRIEQLLDARIPEVDAVAVARLDRLGRDAAELLGLLKRFSSGSLGLVSVADRLDLTTPQGRAMAGVAAVFGQLERELIAERTREALARLRDEGRTYGPVPYGFDSLDGLLVENSQEQRYLAEILAMRNGGVSYGR